MFRKIAIFVKPTESLAGPLTALISVIRKAGAEVFLDERSAKTLGDRAGGMGYTRVELGELCDLAVVLGGDGTMLGVARSLAPSWGSMLDAWASSPTSCWKTWNASCRPFFRDSAHVTCVEC